MTSLDVDYDIVIVGDGIAAKAMLQRIFEARSDLNVLQVADENFAPSCTTHTTSVITGNGIQAGISPLGDKLVKAFYFTQDYLRKYNPPGVECVAQIFLASSEAEREQLVNRYGKEKVFEHNGEWRVNYEATLICPSIFLPWLENTYKSSSSYSSINSFVVRVEKREDSSVNIQLQNGEKVRAQKLILCTGAYSRFLSFGKNFDEAVSFTKPISGTYLTTHYESGSKGFVYSFKGFNLIYRTLDSQLMIGGDANKKFIMAPHFDQMRLFYAQCTEKLKGEVELPPFDNFQLLTGLRHKGRKRMPFWGEVDSNVFAIHSLYKNGYTFSFLAADELFNASGILNS